MTYPTSNMKTGFVLTRNSFHGCDECADGEHGNVTDVFCDCCGWKVDRKAGDFIETRSTP